MKTILHLILIFTSFTVTGMEPAQQNNGSNDTAFWKEGPPLSGKTWGPVTVSYNGYVYVLGGYQNYLPLANVQYAKAGANGALNDWQATTALPAPAVGLQAVAFNGYLYAVGGFSAPGTDKSVYYTKIKSDGTLGTWLSASSLNSSRYAFGLTISDGYLYAVGGLGARNFHGLASTEYVKIKADGSLDSWTTSTHHLPYGIRHLSLVAHNGYLYAAGGITCGGVYICGITGKGMQDLPNVRYAKIGSDGAPAAWQDAASMQVPRAEFGLIALNNKLFAIGGKFFDAMRAYALSSVEAIELGDTGLEGAWHFAPPLPAPRMGFGTAASNGYIYAVAGGTFSHVYGDTIYTDTSQYHCENAIAKGDISQCYYGPDGTQYGITSKLQTWEKQKALASALGGNLASVRSSAENKGIMNNLATTNEVWIGYHYNAQLESWAWADGSDASYTNWAAGEPNHRTSEHCATLFSKQYKTPGQWRNIPCSPSNLLAIIEWR